MGPKLQAPMRSRLARPTGAVWKADKSSLRHEVSLIQGQANQAAHTNSQSHSTVQRRTTVILGKALGAHVIAVSSSAEKLAFCREIGADQTVNHSDGDITDRVRELTGGRGVDVVFDPVGGELGKKALGCMARHGRFGIVGYASGGWVPVNVLEAVLKNHTLAGVFAGICPHRKAAKYTRNWFDWRRQGRFIRRCVGFSHSPRCRRH
jgi:NADPH:quinone reductase-like Zn-dependent oxidoreductase